MSKFSPSTNYEEFDDLIFFSDMDLTEQDVVENYLKDLATSDFLSAKNKLINAKITNYYGAWLPNFWEDGIYAVQNFLKNNEPIKKKPKLNGYKGIHERTSEGVLQYKHWISNEEIDEII